MAILGILAFGFDGLALMSDYIGKNRSGGSAGFRVSEYLSMLFCGLSLIGLSAFCRRLLK